jgi:two-component system, NarL family, sensor kinase
LEVTVYRTAFELVNNALKHADAPTINIQVVQQSDRVALTVHDNGKGFDAGAYKTAGHGLINIENRAAAYGGNMDILSAPGQGTEITVEFNIQQAS